MNTTAPKVEQCSYLNLRATEKGLSEFTSKGARAVFIPKDQVESIQIKFGSYSERPFLQPIMAFFLIALGAVGIDWMWGESARGLRLGVGFLAFGAIGVFCLYEAVKRGYYLAVNCKSGSRKLIPHGSVSEADLARFASEASALGYSQGGK